MHGPTPNAETALGQLLADLDMSTLELATALEANPATVRFWRNGGRGIPGPRVDGMLRVLVARGAEPDRANAALLAHRAQPRKPRQPRPCAPVSPWGGGMPYDWFLARRIEAEGLEEAA